MATLKGTWRFNDELTFPTQKITERVQFTNDTAIVNGLGSPLIRLDVITYTDGYNDSPDITAIDVRYEDDYSMAVGVYISTEGGWVDEAYKTIDFGTEAQTVSAEFYEWLTANATQPTAKITYNGSAIANLFGGQTATLKCEGMKMESDLVVEIAEQTGGGGNGATIVPLTVTENGTYDSPKKLVTETWGDDTEYGLLATDDFPYNFKKAENLVVPVDIETVAPTGTFEATLITGDKQSLGLEELGFEYDAEYGYGCTRWCPAVFFVVDATYINSSFSTNFFENNTVYVTNAYKEYSEYITDVSLTMAGSESADGYYPVVVDVQPKLSSKTIQLNANGQTEVLPYDDDDGLSKVIVNVAYDNTELYSVLNGSVTDIDIRNSKIGKIRDYAFYGCKNLKTITFGSYLNSIGERAFYNTHLTEANSYHNRNSLRLGGTIGVWAFAGCDFDELSIYAERLESGAFTACNLLTSVNIEFPPYGSSQQYIGPVAFQDCWELKQVKITASSKVPNTLYYMYTNSFYNTNIETLTLDLPFVLEMKEHDLGGSFVPDKIYVPTDLVETYKTANGWSKYANKIFAIVE